jgi:hypothetical protein
VIWVPSNDQSQSFFFHYTSAILKSSNQKSVTATKHNPNIELLIMTWTMMGNSENKEN